MWYLWRQLPRVDNKHGGAFFSFDPPRVVTENMCCDNYQIERKTFFIWVGP